MAEREMVETWYSVDTTQLTINTGVLLNDLNSDPLFIPTCTDLQYNQETGVVRLLWTGVLLPIEEARMHVIIAAHVPTDVEMQLSQLPFSEVGTKLWVHASAKPEVAGQQFYTIFTSAGDDIGSGQVGTGTMLQLSVPPETLMQTATAQFDPVHGDVYIHEGYITCSGGGLGDHLIGDVIASATPLQQAVNLDLVVYGDAQWVKLSPGGPGTGTHGFAAAPTLVARTFAKDGDWDYSSQFGLTPNLTGTGKFKISATEKIVNRFVNRMVITQSERTVRLVTEEAAYIAPGYVIRLTVHNHSHSNINASILLSLYRELSFVSENPDVIHDIPL